MEVGEGDRARTSPDAIALLRKAPKFLILTELGGKAKRSKLNYRLHLFTGFPSSKIIRLLIEQKHGFPQRKDCRETGQPS
ncbi:hypothetical protein MiSe_42660 [Microseira wollei NIES-4236]|uniref:Transposase n=1 Tax=Microseira wollei NIES-4236 TaxID=2530354 RepID=A0AAV3X9J5_9CYAN|nr:hypothetical protein MiSe_42660 [Microseira wollei NIES-4236]